MEELNNAIYEEALTTLSTTLTLPSTQTWFHATLPQLLLPLIRAQPAILADLSVSCKSVLWASAFQLFEEELLQLLQLFLRRPLIAPHVVLQRAHSVCCAMAQRVQLFRGCMRWGLDLFLQTQGARPVLRLMSLLADEVSSLHSSMPCGHQLGFSHYFDAWLQPLVILLQLKPSHDALESIASQCAVVVSSLLQCDNQQALVKTWWLLALHAKHYEWCLQQVGLVCQSKAALSKPLAYFLVAVQHPSLLPLVTLQLDQVTAWLLSLLEDLHECVSNQSQLRMFVKTLHIRAPPVHVQDLATSNWWQPLFCELLLAAVFAHQRIQYRSLGDIWVECASRVSLQPAPALWILFYRRFADSLCEPSMSIPCSETDALALHFIELVERILSGANQQRDGKVVAEDIALPFLRFYDKVNTKLSTDVALIACELSARLKKLL